LDDALSGDASKFLNHQITQSPIPSLHFLVRRVLAALAAELAEFQPPGRRLLILGGGVVAVFALSTLQGHDVSWHKTSL
jgi:hypothetical protein